MTILFILAVSLMWGCIGAAGATARNRSAGSWFLICAATGLIGYLVLRTSSRLSPMGVGETFSRALR